MVRLFGRITGRSRGSNDSNDDPSSSAASKLRLSPTAALHNDGVTHSIARNRNSMQQSSLSSPMYEYALDEYAQAVAPGTSNDDGRSVVTTTSNNTATANQSQLNTTAHLSPTTPGAILQAPSNLRGVRRSDGSLPIMMNFGSPNDGECADQCENDVEHGSRGFGHQSFNHGIPSHQHHDLHHQQQQQHSLSHFSHLAPTSSSESAFPSNAATRDSNQNEETRSSVDGNHHHCDSSSNNIRSAFEKDIPDATYDEVYGPAYIGGTIKYIYPTGYQSMRPRSCPWKLSIVVCLLFTWLSVFIVGHCSDQADESAAAAVANANGVITDDALVMEIRWCGSRLLYMMWATSMMVTGISAAYCSVIGYIKVRDFAVANSRSQPPGIAEGKSDYYVRIRDHQLYDDGHGSVSMMNRRNSYATDGGGSSNSYFQSTIYQSDGTPQFWGSHIYRPTQAAVAVTSR